MKKLELVKEKGLKVWNHVKRHKAAYIIGVIVTYIGYHIVKMLSDRGLDKDGKPYYENFDDPVDDLEENKEEE